ncbi:hypothetical protein MBLNU230_g5644t1 [Neophaeotheca triangularis]
MAAQNRLNNFVNGLDGQPAHEHNTRDGAREVLGPNMDGVKLGYHNGKASSSQMKANAEPSHHPNHSQHFSRAPDNDQAVFGTDSSNIDVSSVRSEDMAQLAQREQSQQQRHHQESQRRRSDYDFTEGTVPTYDDQQSKQVSKQSGRPMPPPPPKNQALNTQQGMAPSNRNRQPFVSGRVHGDTYPSESSGPPSAVADVQQSHDLTAQPAQSHPISRPNDVKGGLTQRGLKPTSKQALHHEKRSQEALNSRQGASFHDPHGAVTSGSEVQANAGFSWAPAHQKPQLQQEQRIVPTNQKSQLAMHNSHQGGKSGGSAQQDAPEASRRRNVPKQEVQSHGQNARMHNHQQQGYVPHGRQVAFSDLPHQPQSTRHGQQLDETAHVDSDDTEYDEKQEEATENGERLDYPPQQLYKMDYDALKNEEFDRGPHDNHPNFSMGQHAQDLPSQLQQYKSASPGQKQRFLNSLDIAQWEEAGDWFLDQFGDIVRKMKEARKKRRAAAHEFEAEVEKRHNVISSKRKLTDEALGEMRMNGDKLLLPKKAKGKAKAKTKEG